MKKVNRNWNFDLYRCIAVFFLVLLHLIASFPWQNNSVLLYFHMLSSPVITMFILISGYFCFNKKNFQNQILLKEY